MGLETGSYISALVATNPVGATDPKSQGDDHIRFIKAKLLETFPNIAGEVTPSHTELNLVTGATEGLATLSVSYAATKTLLSTAVSSISAINTLVGQMPTFSASVTSSDITGSVRAPVLQTTGVSAGTYTAATVVIDTKGRITAATAGSINTSWELISTTTGWSLAAATIDIDLQENVYISWIVELEEIAPVNDGRAVIMSGGYSSGTSFTSFSGAIGLNENNAWGTPTWEALGGGRVIPDIGNAAGERGDAYIKVFRTGTTAATGLAYESHSSYINSSGTRKGAWVNGGMDSAQVWDTLRFALSGAGGFKAQGSIRLYGLRGDI